jgi:hypothetical protein
MDARCLGTGGVVGERCALLLGVRIIRFDGVCGSGGSGSLVLLLLVPLKLTRIGWDREVGREEGREEGRVLYWD